MSTRLSSSIVYGFAAGLMLGVIALFVIFSAISCSHMATGATAGGWRIMQPGITIVQTPCALIYVEVKANADHSVFYWRIAIVPKTKTLPEPDPIKPPEA